ncbi:MAG: glycosyl hydrolase [Pseudomonadota bacterium]
MSKVVRTVFATVTVFFLPIVMASAKHAAAQSNDNELFDPALFDSLEYRLIGPFRGGRVTAAAGVRGQEHTFYMGASGGGVWKSTDGGQRWNNVSDGFFEAGSIGSVAIAESDPNIVYVGTGSSAIRGNVSAGVGMYKSTDAGETWSHIGIRDGGQIGDLQIHPDNPDIVYAAVLGHAFGPNEERGVFRTRDGGDTWEKVHFVSNRTGAIDLSMDESNPDVLYAAMWTAERKPWNLVSGSEESGLFKTTDGGDSWTRLSGGLPGPLIGKIEVSVSRSNPDNVYALVEAEEGGLYRSTDAGATWAYVNADQGLRARPWYYNHVHADPVDENVVYVSAEDFWKSTDGGETFELIPVPHGDCHDLWINPDDPETMIESNDGGANVSYNGGQSWSTIMNQPTAEFYRVSVDNQFPYRVYGGQQDNSALSVPSRTTTGGISIQDWYSVAGGESAHVAIDPRNPNITYGGSYGGTLERRDRSSGQTRDIMLFPELSAGQAAMNLKYRVQWNAPIRISPHDPDTIYFASQHLHRTTNEGQTWEIISPDLTHNDPAVLGFSGGPISRDNTGVEVFGTVFAFEESVHAPGLIWAGTDDGRVHITRDGGESWSDITPDGIGQWGTVNMIDLSHHDAGRAFIAVHRYRLDDFTPYIYRTDDFGKSWELLTDGENGIPGNHFVRVVREDPDRRGLLYAGTEFGMYLSFDDGVHWQPFQINLPVSPITDLVVHEKDLVVATQGRAFWILDDLSPLHQLDEQVTRSENFLFKPRDAYRLQGGPARRSGNTNTFRDRLNGGGVDWDQVGDDGPVGAVINYKLGDTSSGPVRLEVVGRDGTVIQTFSSDAEQESLRIPAEPGMNQFVWDLRYPDADIIEDTLFRGTSRGPKAVPGSYEIRLVSAGKTQSQPFEVQKDPRVSSSVADLEDQFQLLMEIRDALTETYAGIGTIRDLKAEVSESIQDSDDDLSEAGKGLMEQLTEVEQRLIEPRIQYREDAWNFPSQLNHFLAYLAQKVGTGDYAPTDAAEARYAELRSMLDDQMARLSEVMEYELSEFNDMLDNRDKAPVGSQP